jgi:hypothetical protein
MSQRLLNRDAHTPPLQLALESRYGMCDLPGVVSAEMTLPSMVRDRLIFAPSFSRTPAAPVESARSEPDKRGVYTRDGSEYR